MSRRSFFAQRLKQARQRAAISQRELGIKAGIDPSAASARINQYERGKHLPNVWIATRLAEVLRVPPPFLYAEDDALALWILAFPETPASVKRTITRKVMTRAWAGRVGA